MANQNTLRLHGCYVIASRITPSLMDLSRLVVVFVWQGGAGSSRLWIATSNALH